MFRDKLACVTSVLPAFDVLRDDVSQHWSEDRHTMPLCLLCVLAYHRDTTRQSVTADFTPVCNLAAPPGESRRIIPYVTNIKPESVFGPLCENMTSSTKLEVRNVLHCCQRISSVKCLCSQVTHNRIYDKSQIPLRSLVRSWLQTG